MNNQRMHEMVEKEKAMNTALNSTGFVSTNSMSSGYDTLLRKCTIQYMEEYYALQRGLINTFKEFESKEYELMSKRTKYDFVCLNSDNIIVGLMDKIKSIIDTYNEFEEETNRYSVPKNLPVDCIAQILLSTDVFAKMKLDDGSFLIGMYQQSGSDMGIYRLLETEDDMLELFCLATQLHPGLTKLGRNELVQRILQGADEKKECNDSSVSAVGNGIWNFESQEFIPYSSPESKKYIFTKKIKTNYNAEATNPCIPFEKDGKEIIFNVDEWLHEFFYYEEKKDDPEHVKEADELTNFLWEILHAFCRPNVNYRKSIWFGNPNGNGNNGKGTFTSLICSLLGAEVCKSMNMKEFDGRFALQGITHCIAILGDENAFTTKIQDVSRYKNMITRDAVQVEVKYGKSFRYKFKGLILQCFNEYPPVNDTTGSFARRILLLNWTKSFTGHEKPEIKDIYIQDKRVLEYILNRILNLGDIETFSQPAAVKRAEELYLNKSLLIDRFVDKFLMPLASDNADEVQMKLKWTRIPVNFLYDLYCSWFDRNWPDGTVDSSKGFKTALQHNKELRKYWKIENTQKTWRKSDATEPEPLIKEYHLDNWCSEKYKEKEDNENYCFPEHLIIKTKYRCFISRK